MTRTPSRRPAESDDSARARPGLGICQGPTRRLSHLDSDGATLAAAVQQGRGRWLPQSRTAGVSRLGRHGFRRTAALSSEPRLHYGQVIISDITTINPGPGPGGPGHRPRRPYGHQ